MKTDLQNSLRATRNRLGLSQQQLAEASGITRQTIGGIEAGLYAPSATVALRLAKALGCRVEELFWLEDHFPTIQATPAANGALAGSTRVAIARVGTRWVAHALEGENAFRTEMVPADGTCEWNADQPDMDVQLLEDPENLARSVVVAGCTPALSLWARSTERWYPGLRVQWIHANSMNALASLGRREVHAAGIHLCDPETGEYNVPFVRRMLPNDTVVLINLGVWEEGLVVQTGNPKGIQRAADLARPDVNLVNRDEGAGSRLLLDSVLQIDGVAVTSLNGYGNVVKSHQDVARQVASGESDVGVSTASVASLYGLSFISLQTVRYDLAVRKESMDEEPVRQVLSTLQHRWIRSQLQVVGGFDTAQTGEIVAEVGPNTSI